MNIRRRRGGAGPLGPTVWRCASRRALGRPRRRACRGPLRTSMPVEARGRPEQSPSRPGPATSRGPPDVRGEGSATSPLHVMRTGTSSRGPRQRRRHVREGKPHRPSPSRRGTVAFPGRERFAALQLQPASPSPSRPDAARGGADRRIPVAFGGRPPKRRDRAPRTDRHHDGYGEAWPRGCRSSGNSAGDHDRRPGALRCVVPPIKWPSRQRPASRSQGAAEGDAVEDDSRAMGLRRPRRTPRPRGRAIPQAPG